MKTELQDREFVTSRYDRAFKYVFLDDNDLSLLEEFLSEILNKDVKVIKLLREGLPVTNVLEKSKTVDALIQADGELIHVELNSSMNNVLRFRNFVFFSSVISQSTSRGKSYNPNVKYLHIDFSYGLGHTKDYVNKYQVSDEFGNLYVENVDIIEYNMDRFMEYWYDKDEKNIKKYLPLIMLDLNKEELENLGSESDLVKKYGEKITDLNEKEWFHSFVTAEEDAEFLRNTYKELGMEEGLEQGMQQGMQKGMEAKQQEIIKNMLTNGLSVDEIHKMTNIPIEEVDNLKNSISKES